MSVHVRASWWQPYRPDSFVVQKLAKRFAKLCVAVHDQILFSIQKTVFAIGDRAGHLFHPGFVRTVVHVVRLAAGRQLSGLGPDVAERGSGDVHKLLESDRSVLADLVCVTQRVERRRGDCYGSDEIRREGNSLAIRCLVTSLINVRMAFASGGHP
jgi:hypothetical protein